MSSNYATLTNYVSKEIEKNSDLGELVTELLNKNHISCNVDEITKLIKQTAEIAVYSRCNIPFHMNRLWF